MNREFQDFGQQAIYEFCLNAGARQWEAKRYAESAPSFKSEQWVSLETQTAKACKELHIGWDAEHAKLLRQREDKQAQIDELEGDLAAIESKIAQHEKRNLDRLLSGETEAA